jgi:hypothetical protein
MTAHAKARDWDEEWVDIVACESTAFARYRALEDELQSYFRRGVMPPADVFTATDEAMRQWHEAASARQEFIDEWCRLAGTPSYG